MTGCREGQTSICLRTHCGGLVMTLGAERRCVLCGRSDDARSERSESYRERLIQLLRDAEMNTQGANRPEGVRTLIHGRRAAAIAKLAELGQAVDKPIRGGFHKSRH